MNKIRVKDIYLSAFLKCRGVPFDGIERKRNFSFFLFIPNEETDELMQAYFKGKVHINIQNFRACLRDLKSLASGDIPMPHNGDKGGIKFDDEKTF